MKVVFITSTSKLPEYFPIYKQICEIIVSLGHELTRDWIDEALQNQETKNKVDFDKLYADIITSIINADVAIVEGTVKGLTAGHQMTIALQKGKPVLHLHQSTNRDMFSLTTNGVISELLNDEVYTNTNELPEIIEKFLEENKTGKKTRFNLVLSSQEDRYIEWSAFIHKKSKTELIRGLIRKEMKADDRYKNADV